MLKKGLLLNFDYVWFAHFKVSALFSYLVGALVVSLLGNLGNDAATSVSTAVGAHKTCMSFTLKDSLIYR